METPITKLRPLLQTILYWIVFIAFLMISGFAATSFLGGGNLYYGITGSFGAFACTWVFLKWEKKTFADVGLAWDRKTLLNFIKGLLIGAAIYGLVFGTLIFASGLKVTLISTPFITIIVPYLAFIPLSLMEEVGFRSYPFLKQEKHYGLIAAQVIGAFAFGCYHLLNGWNFYAAFLGAGAWSFVFGLAAYHSGGISMAVGLHAAINMLQTATGIKGGTSFVQLDYSNASKSDTTGLVLQVIILALALAWTIYVGRKPRRANV